MNTLESKPETVKTCLISGIEHEYDLCDSDEKAYSRFMSLKLHYLGQGKIWCANGINQNSERTLHFWKRV